MIYELLSLAGIIVIIVHSSCIRWCWLVPTLSTVLSCAVLLGKGFQLPPGADLGFYNGGCPVHLKGAPKVERQRRRWGGVWVWEKKFSTYDMTSPLDYQVPYCATTADVSNLLEFVQKSVK